MYLKDIHIKMYYIYKINLYLYITYIGKAREKYIYRDKVCAVQALPTPLCSGQHGG